VWHDKKVFQNPNRQQAASDGKHLINRLNMNHFFKILTFSSALFFSSCISTHTGSIQPSSFSTNNNFKIITTIEGKSQAVYILGIGGNYADGLVNEAKKNMYINYTLKSNQNLTNITTDIKKTYFILPLLYMSQTVIVSADVIQFYSNNNNLIEENKIVVNRAEPNKEPSKETNKEPNKESNNVPNNEPNTQTVLYPKLQSIKESGAVKVLEYQSISEVKVGDYVQTETAWGDLIYGEVVELISMKKLKVRLEPTPHTIVYDEFNFKKCKKVVVE
jgi:hypothetical protein